LLDFANDRFWAQRRITWYLCFGGLAAFPIVSTGSSLRVFVNKADKTHYQQEAAGCH
jgi:hypothetical protein